MSPISNNQGRAYEYVWIHALYNALSKIRKTQIAENSSLHANKRAWELIDDKTHQLLELSANSAVDTILELEPLMFENEDDTLILEFQQDHAGIKGDVRDILIKRNDIYWEIGLSIKHNNDSVKHSRLSYKLDFGKEWFNTPCSISYWNNIKPIFDRLSYEKSKEKKWSEIVDKENTVYVPLLTAFINEVLRVNSIDSDLPKKMIEYLIGTKDYYKIVSHDSNYLTLIYTFNTHGTLNKPSKIKVSAIKVPFTDLPTELIAMRFKNGSKNTVEMYLNNGWQLSFRIHNASSNVEPSLKFDIKLIGKPVSILNIECKWK